jgi:hypothetical protein
MIVYYSVVLIKRLECYSMQQDKLELRAYLGKGLYWIEMLKFNQHCNNFVLFDKKFLILD